MASRVRLLTGVVALTLLACQSPTPNFRDPGEIDQFTLGELVFEILRDQLEVADECSPELVSELDSHRDDFVTSFDYAISEDVVDELPDLLGGTIVPIVRSEDLPALTDAIAETLALLISDELDPDRLALHSLANIADTRTVLEGSHAIRLVAELLADPTLEDKIHALAGLALEDDGADQAIDSILDIAARQLSDDEPSACSGIEIGPVEENLLRTEGYWDDPALGSPAYAARADDNGNPRVRVNSLTGALYAPFVDGDGDGVADVDARGRPVDGDGAPIALDAFARGDDGRDSHGRLTGPDGDFVFDYYDAKRTTLSHTLQLGHDALAAGVHHDVADLANAVLGDQVPCSDGTDTCRHYPDGDHVLADTVYLLGEVARPAKVRALIESLALIVRDEPELAEDLFVAIGQLVAAMEGSDLELTDPALMDIAIEIMPLVSGIFEKDAAGGESTARLLFDVIHEMGDTARDFPDELLLVTRYSDLVKAEQCSADPPDVTRSTIVNYSEPRWMGETDNRSTLEQGLELLANIDCGSVPLTGGKSVAHVVLDLMADQSPDTVCGLIDLLMGVLDVLPGASEFIVSGALDLLGCDGSLVFRDIQAVDTLAKSGSLDFLLPLAAIFKERGQLPLLLELIHFVRDDLVKDEDEDPTTQSVIRRALPPIIDVLETDAPDVIFDLLDLLVTVEAVDGEGTLADTMVDSIEVLARDGVEVRTRTRTVGDTSLVVQLLYPIREMMVKLNEAEAQESLCDIMSFATGYLTRTRMEAGELRLEHRNLIPLMAVLLQTASDALDLPREDYLCYVDELQQGGVEALTGRDFATLVRLLDLLRSSEHGPILEEWIVSLLNANPGPDDPDVYGPLVQVGSEVLDSPIEGDDLTNVLSFLGHAADARRNDAADLIQIVDQLFITDEDDAIQQIVSNLIEPGPLPSMEEPLCTFTDTFSSTAAIEAENMCVADGEVSVEVADMEELIDSMACFLGEGGGMDRVYALVGQARVMAPPTDE